MHFTSTTLALLLPLLAVTAPYSSSSNPQHPFQLIAIDSGSPIQYARLTASNGFFYINNGPPATFTNAGSPHPHSPGKLNLYASVPGGQQVYVIASSGPETPNAGALAYTPAHSHDIPKGSYTDGFLVEPAGKGAPKPFGGFEFTEGVGEKGILYACKGGDRDDYQVFADVKGLQGNLEEDCLSFKVDTVAYEGKEPTEF